MDTCKTGTVTGTGSAITIRTGFRPAAVFLFNATDVGTLWWSRTLTDDYGHKSDGADGAETALTSKGITPQDNGFIIGDDADLNGASDAIHWIAWRGEPV